MFHCKLFCKWRPSIIIGKMLRSYWVFCWHQRFFIGNRSKNFSDWTFIDEVLLVFYLMRKFTKVAKWIFTLRIQISVDSIQKSMRGSNGVRRLQNFWFPLKHKISTPKYFIPKYFPSEDIPTQPKPHTNKFTNFPFNLPTLFKKSKGH